MIKALGDKLQALHLHDNDLWHDSHQIPLSMKIDFVGIMRAFKEIGYKGYLMLEAETYLHAYHHDNIFEGIQNLAASVRKLNEL